MKSEQIRISAKNLGEVALPNFCPRCFWIKLKLSHRLPFNIFPGIFSSIDAYTKRVVHDHFDREGRGPGWLDGLGDFVGYLPPPHHSKFMLLIEEFNILLTGSPDGVLVKRDQTKVIVDYKTAKFTATQDALLPMYKAQLNAYSLLGNMCGLAPVFGLGLLYFEPMTDDPSIRYCNTRGHGFALDFSAHLLEVERNEPELWPLLERTREIHERRRPPAGQQGCKNCELLDQVTQNLGNKRR